MSKHKENFKKDVHRAASAAKKTIENAKNEALETVDGAASSAVDAKDAVVETVMSGAEKVEDIAEDATDTSKETARRTRRRKNKDIRNWLIVIAIILVAFFGYRYFANGGTTKLAKVFGGPLAGVIDVDPTNQQQWGYAVGSIIGQQVLGMLEQAPGADDMDMDMFVRGLNDAVRENENAPLSEDQVQALLEGRMQHEQEQMIKEAQENKELGAVFVEEYAQREGVAKTEGGTLYRVLTEGEGQALGENGAQLHYRGTLISGEEFDSSRKDGNEEPVSFVPGGVIAGFGEVLALMSVGDRWEVVIPADQAYGEYGIPGSIGPNETLIFDIEVIDSIEE